MSKQNILGVDVARDELVVYNNLDGSITSVINTEDSIKKAQKENDWQTDKYIVALESTGNCSFLPMQYFVKAGFKVILLNPIVTKRLTRATVRTKKTDISDAKAISILAEQGEGQIVREKDLEIAKKTLLRLENKLTHMKSDLKRMKGALETKQKAGIELNRAIEQIEHLIKETEKSAQNLWKLSCEEETSRQEEIIASHIGCGEKLSSIISTEAGDLKRFASARQFKAYAGIDPRIYQSGKKCVTGRMTKRGNSYLRSALYLASFVASMHDPELSVYYRKKRNKGKSHKHAVCTVARKLCERIYSTVIQDRLYIPRYPQENMA